MEKAHHFFHLFCFDFLLPHPGRRVAIGDAPGLLTRSGCRSHLGASRRSRLRHLVTTVAVALGLGHLDLYTIWERVPSQT
jgi:hypothetical protein